MPDAPPPRVTARQVILSASALWLCYFVLITVRGLVVELGEFEELLWRRALVTVAGIVVTVLVWPLLRRFDGRSLGVRALAALFIMFPAALASAFVNQLAFAPVEKRILAKIGEQQASNEEQGRASSIQVRHDMAGNVLVDVLDESMMPRPPAPPAPQPGPQAAPAPGPKPAPTANPAPPAPPAPPVPNGITRLEDGTTVIRSRNAEVRRAPDGSTEIRTRGMVIRTNPDDEVESIDRTGEDSAEGEPMAIRPAPPAPPVETVPPTPPITASQPAPAPPQRPRIVAERKVARPAPLRTEAAPEGAASRPPPPAATTGTTTHSTVKIIEQKVEDEGLWRQLTDVALGRYFLLLAWAALYLALGNAAQVQAAERREGEFKRAAKAAELRSLRYQVNPHFLFNTLNSLSALVMSGRSEKAERMIQTMSNFYRHSLASDPTADMPLADEIALQRHYLEIEAVRFPERLRTEFDVPESLADACVPGMILQPLVENSVKYAVSATASPVTIRISAREAAGKLVLTVSDDGPGKPEGPGGTGIGLANVRDRLAARFGDEASVETGPLPAGGYSTTLILPVTRNDC